MRRHTTVVDRNHVPNLGLAVNSRNGPYGDYSSDLGLKKKSVWRAEPTWLGMEWSHPEDYGCSAADRGHEGMTAVP